VDDDIKSDNPNVEDDRIVSLLEYKPSKTPKKTIVDDRNDDEYFVNLPVDNDLIYKETGRRRKPYPWEDNFETSSDLSDEEKQRLTVIYPKMEYKTRIISDYKPYKYEAKNKGEITNKYKSDFSPEMAKNLPFNQSTPIKKVGNIIISNTKFYAPFGSGITARKIWQEYFNLKKGKYIESGQRFEKPSYIKGNPNKSIKSNFGKQNGDYIKSKISPNAYTDYGLNILKLIDAMDAYYGVPYLLGGTSKKSIDCSAFTWRVFQSLGLAGSRTGIEPFGKTCQYQMSNVNNGDSQPGGTLILKIKDLKFGDLVFFDTQLTHFPGHVGIYLTDGFIHHSGSPNQVMWINEWYSSRFVAGKRYYKQDLQWMQANVYKPSVKRRTR
jgi:cell wall-associated NlpC family hydrolase